MLYDFRRSVSDGVVRSNAISGLLIGLLIGEIGVLFFLFDLTLVIPLLVVATVSVFAPFQVGRPPFQTASGRFVAHLVAVSVISAVVWLAFRAFGCGLEGLGAAVGFLLGGVLLYLFRDNGECRGRQWGSSIARGSAAVLGALIPVEILVLTITWGTPYVDATVSVALLAVAYVTVCSVGILVLFLFSRLRDRIMKRR